jgi:hypothetical protein
MSTKKQHVDISNTPQIPDVVYEKLPKFLKDCCDQFSKRREKDVFLTCTLGAVSGCLPEVKGRYYMRLYYPNLYTLIIAPPANGKGVIRFVKLLGTAIHKRLLADSVVNKEGDTLVEDDVKEGNKKPQVKTLFIPADTSSAMLLQHLQNNGGKGIIIESEADTLVNSFKQEWGAFSDRLRAAFEHESITYSRKSDEGKHIEIESPKISIVLAGTPQQAKSLIPSAENGLASRFIYYVYRQPYEWTNPMPCANCMDPDRFFTDMGEQLLHIADYFEQNPMEVKLTEDQWTSLTSVFKEELQLYHTSHGDDAPSSVFRMGVIAFRIMMILTALRTWETQESGPQVQCTDDDFSSAIALAGVYLQHTSVMLELIPGSNAQSMVQIKDKFYSDLPMSFTRGQAVIIGQKSNISERSVGRYLAYFLKKGKLTQPKMGEYTKIE